MVCLVYTPYLFAGYAVIHPLRLAVLIAALVEIVLNEGINKQTSVILFLSTGFTEKTSRSARVNLTWHVAGAATARAAETKENQSKECYGAGGCNQEPGGGRAIFQAAVPGAEAALCGSVH